MTESLVQLNVHVEVRVDMLRVEHILAMLTFALFILLMGIAGNSDYEAAKLEELAYCDRVADKVHTDYENICK